MPNCLKCQSGLSDGDSRCRQCGFPVSHYQAGRKLRGEYLLLDCSVGGENEIVWRAKQIGGRQELDIAVSELAPMPSDQAQTIAALQPWRAACKKAFPNVPKLWDAFTQRDHIFACWSLDPGTTLRDLAQTPTLSPQRFEEIWRNSVTALSRLHDATEEFCHGAIDEGTIRLANNEVRLDRPSLAAFASPLHGVVRIAADLRQLGLAYRSVLGSIARSAEDGVVWHRWEDGAPAAALEACLGDEATGAASAAAVLSLMELVDKAQESEDRNRIGEALDRYRQAERQARVPLVVQAIKRCRQKLGEPEPVADQAPPGPQPVQMEPAPVEPAPVAAAQAEPIQTEPSQATPSQAPPIFVEPVWVEPAWEEPPQAESNAAGTAAAATPEPAISPPREPENPSALEPETPVASTQPADAPGAEMPAEAVMVKDGPPPDEPATSSPAPEASAGPAESVASEDRDEKDAAPADTESSESAVAARAPKPAAAPWPATGGTSTIFPPAPPAENRLRTQDAPWQIPFPPPVTPGSRAMGIPSVGMATPMPKSAPTLQAPVPAPASSHVPTPQPRSQSSSPPRPGVSNAGSQDDVKPQPDPIATASRNPAAPIPWLKFAAVGLVAAAVAAAIYVLATGPVTSAFKQAVAKGKLVCEDSDCAYPLYQRAVKEDGPSSGTVGEFQQLVLPVLQKKLKDALTGYHSANTGAPPDWKELSRMAAWRKEIETSDVVSAEAEFFQGMADLEDNKLDDAIGRFDRAIELSGNWALPWNGKGRALFRQNQVHEAISAFQQAAKLDQNWAEPHLNLGNLYLQSLNNPDEAKAEDEKALEIRPDLPVAEYSLGVVYQAKGSDFYPLSCQHLKRALASTAGPPLETYQMKNAAELTTTMGCR